MASNINLQQLAIDRKALYGARTGLHAPGRLARWLGAGVVGMAVVGVGAWYARERFLEPAPVKITAPQLSEASVTPARATSFQCAGWVEPRPTPITVSSLTEGVIDRLTVIEGQEVNKGDPVAYLVSQDADLAVQLAEAELAMRKSELLSAEAELVAAKQYFVDPTARLAAVAEVEVELSKVETELARLPAQILAAESRQAVAEKEHQTKTAAKEAVPAISVERSRGDVEVAKAQIEEYRRQGEFLNRERAAIAGRLSILKRQLELKVDEKLAVSAAEAAIAGAKAQVARAEGELAVANLRKDRTIIRAPIDGRILALTSRPGSRLMGLSPSAMADSSSVVTMYDPQQLQVRADVRLENVAQVQVGQEVEIETSAVDGPIKGRVITATSVADIQKNTLQIKVSIDNPPEVIRPDMLVQVTFLAAAESSNELELAPASTADASQPEHQVVTKR